MTTRDEAARNILSEDRGFKVTVLHKHDQQYGRELRLIEAGWNSRDAEVEKLWEMNERASGVMTGNLGLDFQRVMDEWLKDFEAMKKEAGR